MNHEPRTEPDYSERQIEAARRVLVDVGQVLAAFQDCLVLIGGWVPDLLIPNAAEPHIGSIDVDLALDAFHDSRDPDTRAMQARRAYELVRRFLEMI